MHQGLVLTGQEAFVVAGVADSGWTAEAREEKHFGYGWSLADTGRSCGLQPLAVCLL